ncbi:hypothetical protein EIP91_001194 [Steccherinum ochraceum]|uniref:DUF6534 domain-containing protein n=1 Tax=Steccherinum ochraceum TaxID=92696 RepID=A0A4R0RSN3_9APHY|nr:hypothetical protein EIP91_001194 [Steccherinum ochraceum]
MSGAPVTDDSQAFKKASQTVERPPVIDNINDQYFRDPPNNLSLPTEPTTDRSTWGAKEGPFEELDPKQKGVLGDETTGKQTKEAALGEAVTENSLLGYLFDWGLFDIYHIAFPYDTWQRKSVVCTAYLLEFIQVILATHDAFRVYGSGWGVVPELDKIGLLWLNTPLFAGLISCLSQLFYAHRIYALSGNSVASAVISALAVTQATASVYGSVQVLLVGRLSILPTITIIYRLCIVWLGGAALCDSIITCCLFYYLYRAMKACSFRRTTTPLTRVIKLTVETGFICAAIGIASLILFVVSTHTFIYMTCMATIGKLYSNCLLAVLNSRVRILNGRNGTDAEDALSFFHVSTDRLASIERTNNRAGATTQDPRLSGVESQTDETTLTE